MGVKIYHLVPGSMLENRLLLPRH